MHIICKEHQQNLCCELNYTWLTKKIAGLYYMSLPKLARTDHALQNIIILLGNRWTKCPERFLLFLTSLFLMSLMKAL